MLKLTVEELTSEFNDLINSMFILYERNKPAVKQIQLIILDLMEALRDDTVDPEILEKARYVDTLALKLESWSHCKLSIQKRGHFYDVVMNVNAIPYAILGTITDPDYDKPVRTRDQVKEFIEAHKKEYEKIIGRRYDCYNELPIVRLRRLVIKPITQALAQKPRRDSFNGLILNPATVML